MAITKKVRLVFSDLGKNSYKFWDGDLHDDGTFISRFGVVGASNPQECNYGSVGESFMEKKVREKLKKGYEHARVIIDGPEVATQEVPRGSLADIALSQIRFSNEAIKKLIRRLADSNVHKITSSTSIQFNQATGLFQTPLGIVTSDGIDAARNLLPFFMGKTAIDAEYKKNLDAYLRIIPRNKGNKLRYEDIFPDQNALQKESDLLDALQNSLDIVSKPKAPEKKKKGEKEAPVEQVFKLKLDVLDDDKERARIIKWYEDTKKSMHHYDNVKVREIYAIDIEDYNADFDAHLANQTEVWHGSSQANILSIGKVGLKCSPPSTAAIAGKMFGNGVYGSQTSSKSLGYTMGRWGQSTGDSGWLFVCDFAMGNPYYPTHSIQSIPAGYDSCWALPAKTRLHNDELIVYKERQIRVKYLLECK